MFSYLLRDYLGYLRIAVSQGIDCNPGGEIEVFSVLNIPEIHSFTLDKHWRWADVGLHHEGSLFVDESGGGRVRGWIGV